MRVVLFATGYRSEMEPLVKYRPTSLLNIADKPIIFHIIEFLIQQGIKKYDLILNHLPTLIEEKLEDGKRWGIEITYHLAKDPEYPFLALKPAAKSWLEETILIGSGDTLPSMQPSDLAQDVIEQPPFMAFSFKKLVRMGPSLSRTFQSVACQGD